MSDTDGENYIKWKHWNSEKFALVDSGASYYFDQLFKKNRILRDRSKIIEIGFGNGELLGYLRKHDHKIKDLILNDYDKDLMIENIKYLIYEFATYDTNLRNQ